MKNKLHTRYILRALAAAGAALLALSCVDEKLSPVTPGEGELPDEVTIDCSMYLPVTSVSQWGSTKAFTEVPQVARLYVACFDASDMLYDIRMAYPGTQQHPTDLSAGFQPGPAEDEYITNFHVTLKAVAQGDRYLQFIAVSKPIDEWESTVETDIMDESGFVRDLLTSGTEVAYWSRRKVTYITEQTNFTKLQMIRNFSKVSVTSDVSTDTFELLGYRVFNAPKSGTIAPFNNNAQHYEVVDGRQVVNFNRFANYAGAPVATPYTYLTETDRYFGYMPQSPSYETFADKYNASGSTDGDLTTSNFWCDPAASGDSKYDYLYECTYNSANNPFIIIKARWRKDTSSSWGTYYYKADFVFGEGEAKQYYNILRNFLYTLKITSVNGKGSDTIYDAVNSIALNNFEASTLSQQLTNIANDDTRLYVSQTDVLITGGTSFKMYVKNKTGSDFSGNGNGQISAMIKDPTSGQRIVAADSCIVIASKDTTISGDLWREVTVKTASVDSLGTGEVWIQPIVFKNTSGLVRTVQLTMRAPFSLTVDAQDYVYPGRDTTVTVDFSIPSGFTEFRFPMYFYIEQEENTLYPMALAEGARESLSVLSGPSNIPGRSDNNYYYRRTITWAEYRAAAPDINGIRTFRSYFRTLVPRSETTVWVFPDDANNYFSPVDGGNMYTNLDSFSNDMLDGSVSFERSALQLHIDTSVTPAVADTVRNRATANSGGTVTYTSSDESVAKVDQDGYVSAVGVGDAVITASVPAYRNYGSAYDSFPVTVSASALTGLSVSWTSEPVYVVKVGSTAATTGQYSAMPGDYSGTVSTAYASDNTAVATVSASGVVTGVSAGTAKITYTASATADGTYIAATQSASYTLVVVADHPSKGTVYHEVSFLGDNLGDYTITEQKVTDGTAYTAGTDRTTEFTTYTTYNTGAGYAARSVWYPYYNRSTGIGFGAAASGYGAYDPATTYYESAGSVVDHTDYHNYSRASHARLSSKSIDLSCSAGASVTFYHAGNYFYNRANMASDVKVLISKDGGSSWTTLNVSYPDGNSWVYVKAHATIPSDYLVAGFRIAFDYTSVGATFVQKTDESSNPLYYKTVVVDGDTRLTVDEVTTDTGYPVMVVSDPGRAGTWEIKNLTITED